GAGPRRGPLTGLAADGAGGAAGGARRGVAAGRGRRPPGQGPGALGQAHRSGAGAWPPQVEVPVAAGPLVAEGAAGAAGTPTGGAVPAPREQRGGKWTARPGVSCLGLAET